MIEGSTRLAAALAKLAQPSTYVGDKMDKNTYFCLQINTHQCLRYSCSGSPTEATRKLGYYD